MSILSKHVLAVLAGCAVLWAGAVRGDDWPQWMGANRNAKVANFKAPAKWPTELTPKWKVAIGQGDSSIALVKDKVFAFGRQGAEEVVFCLEAATGKEVWNLKYAAPAVTGAAARQHPGTRSSPLVVEGHVVTLGASGILTCINAETGKQEWQKNEFPNNVPQFFVAMSPIAVDGLVIAHLGGPNNAAIEAFDLKTGEVKWKWAGDAPSYSSPVLMTVEGVKQIVTQSQANVVSLGAADGKLLWQIPFAVSGMGYNAATPIVDGSTVIYTGQARGTTAVKVEKKGDGLTTTQLWKNATVGTQFNTPVLKDGFLYGMSDRATFFCINAANGETAWQDTVRRGGNYCGIVDAGSTLIALPNTGELIAYKPNSKAYEEIAKIKVGSAVTFAFPVVDGNKIYVRDDTNLVMFVVE